MKLTRYRVTNFRSVKDSDWIDANDVTALIGVNESGKTNLLLPLWKLNPAREGEIHPTSDYPKHMFGEIREQPSLFRFIEAEFETGGLAKELSSDTGVPVDQLARVRVTRFYNGAHRIAFPDHVATRAVPGDDVRAQLSSLIAAVAGAAEDGHGSAASTALLATAKTWHDAPAEAPWDAARLASALEQFKTHTQSAGASGSAIDAGLTALVERLERWLADVSSVAPHDRDGVAEKVLAALPKFVYYSNYGNLDSEIYLPHVVNNLERTDLGSKESSKSRTLKVLFSFVRLSPREILELGKDHRDTHPGREPSAEQISAVAEKKRERSILLHSAGATLTKKFKDWWKQGNYRFRFDADGHHFRIWVADDQRPEEVELETRSTGLQWFLSFFLVFLVESMGDHKDAILLLDEPGLSLHPLAQRDLSSFFDGLVQTNQILYTTHSPFLVDADRLDRVRKVYVAADGTTRASPDLRLSGASKAQAGAAYAVYSALNLTLAESLLLGCVPIVVEGPSDQHYLTLIKTLLVGGGKIAPTRELVFPPAGGTKTLRQVASILTGRDDQLPLVLLDGDAMGARMAKELSTSLYEGETSRLLSTDTFTAVHSSEVEDLIPADRFAEAVDKTVRSGDRSFSDVLEAGKPLVGQVEAWAKRESIDLPTGWKVEVAKKVKSMMLNKGLASVDQTLVGRWVRLFDALLLQSGS